VVIFDGMNDERCMSLHEEVGVDLWSKQSYPGPKDDHGWELGLFLGIDRIQAVPVEQGAKLGEP